MHTLKKSRCAGLIFPALVWCALGTNALRADEFCALTVTVVPESGSFTSTWIELDDPSGKAELKRQVFKPTFTICDFGFGPHTLWVGINECLPVGISNLQVRLDRPLFLRVAPNSCGYRDMRSACLVYFRVTDRDGNPVSNATLSPLLVRGSPATDSYGRWQGLVAGDHDVTLSAPGFDAASASIKCRQDEEIDVPVVMARSREPVPPR